MSIIPSFAIGNISVNTSATETPRSVELCVFGTTAAFRGQLMITLFCKCLGAHLVIDDQFEQL